MKVAIVTTRHGAQDDRIYYKEALSLAKRMDVTMIAPDDGENLEWAPGVAYQPIPRRRSALGRLWSLVEATLAVRSERPEFCHVHDLDLALAIPFIRLLTKANVIYDSHEAFPEQIRINERIPKRIRQIAAGLVDVVEKWLAGRASHVVTADDPTTDSFNRARVPATTVFNYPALRIFETNTEELSASCEADLGRKVLLYHGTISLDRGLLHMIDALSIIARVEPSILLRLVGVMNERLGDLAWQRARDAGVENNLEVSGWKHYAKIAYVIKSSDIGLVPLQPNEKYKRNIPIKIFEYMACGIPLVAADLAPIAKFLDRVDCGLLYDSTRPEELARCVLELLANPERRRRMGANGLRAVRERWNWDKMEDVLFGIYESLGANHKEVRS
jgi:glycosyltransferase involved in cell wall biosynthesis